MTYDNELKLISTTTTKDEIGQEVEIESETIILCATKSINQTEFYAAGQEGLRPDITFIIHAYEYNGEDRVVYNGQKYKVLRTFGQGIEEIELHCKKVAGYE